MGVRVGFGLVAAVVLAGCQAPVPDSGAGVGFNDYLNYQAKREQELLGNAPVRTVPNAGAISAETSATGDPAQPSEAELLAQQTRAALGTTPDNVGISDEQDFQAVASRESIESDAERIAANRQAYEVVEPGALPTRSGGSSLSGLVDFALSTTNTVGQALYSRSLVFAQSRFDKNCAKYPSPDKAQEAFLERGGPKRDPMGLDPDGDGFACSWDPAPFRLARSGG